MRWRLLVLLLGGCAATTPPAAVAPSMPATPPTRLATGLVPVAGPRRELGFTAFALQGDPRRLGEEPVRLRLYQERPALEVYLHVNLPGLEVEVREKDGEFRGALVTTLLT